MNKTNTGEESFGLESVWVQPEKVFTHAFMLLPGTFLSAVKVDATHVCVVWFAFNMEVLLELEAL